MSDDSAFYERALGRMDRIAYVLAAAAVVVFTVRDGWRGGLACGLCSAASIWNLRRLKSVAAGIGGETRVSTASAVGSGFRYLILAGGAFAIIRYFEVSLPPVFAGLLISVAAVLVEMLYELFTRQ